MRRLVFTKDALRTLDKLPVNIGQRIRAKLDQYIREPHAFANNIKALRGSEGLFRMRIGDWRVLFTETGQVVRIIKVAPRGAVYKAT